MKKQFACTVGFFSLGLLVLVGCNTAEDQNAPIPADASQVDEHGHAHGEGGHEHAESLGEAVEELTELRNTVRDAFAAEDPDTAHGPLHDVGHILEEVSEMAEKEELSEEQLASVKSAVDKLFDSFGAVDKMMHGEEGSEYSEVSGDIDAAIATLTEIASESSHDDEHHHEEGDDDDHEHEEDHGDDADGEGESSEEPQE